MCISEKPPSLQETNFWAQAAIEMLSESSEWQEIAVSEDSMSLFFLLGIGWGSVLSLVLFELYFISQTK